MNQILLILLGLHILQQTSSTTPPVVTYGCEPGTSAVCKKAKFVPGHTLLGEGVNIVTMKTTGSFLLDLQKTGKTCTLCRNPHSNNVLEKLPKALVDWRPETSCSRNVVSSSSESTVSLANEATSSVQNDWKVGLDIEINMMKANTAVGGSHSNMAKFGNSKKLTDKYNFLSHKLECSYYSFHLSPSAPLTSHFAKDLKNLPATYDAKTKGTYKRLIAQYGTHYITHAKAGGRIEEITAVRACQVTLDGMTVDEVKDCLNVEAKISASSIDKSAEFNSQVQHCKEKSKNSNHGDSFHQRFNERIWEVKGGKATFDLLSAGKEKSTEFQNWMESLKTDPGLVSYSLDPIHNLVKFAGPQKENLRLAVGDYIKENALQENCSCSGHSSPSHGRECSCICPPTKHTTSDCCPTKKGIAKLHVTFKEATGLRGDRLTKTDGYVKFKFGSDGTRTQTIWNNDNPKWNAVYELDFVELAANVKYTIEVWDEDNGYDDDLLGKCEKTLTSGDKLETCYLNHGSFTYSLRVLCSTYLHGPLCENYGPVSPK
ncbi:perforin-1-like [Hyperolius riggenbachi]|uniref:perforin-1-like n=1 Tax=Hyperolius riggenbachi TaxID=752182 RepID=UPI0035A3594A